jgi:hypothetical protein
VVSVKLIETSVNVTEQAMETLPRGNGYVTEQAMGTLPQLFWARFVFVPLFCPLPACPAGATVWLARKRPSAALAPCQLAGRGPSLPDTVSGGRGCDWASVRLSNLCTRAASSRGAEGECQAYREENQRYQ